MITSVLSRSCSFSFSQLEVRGGRLDGVFQQLSSLSDGGFVACAVSCRAALSFVLLQLNVIYMYTEMTFLSASDACSVGTDTHTLTWE
eukprot:gene27112-33789_t